MAMKQQPKTWSTVRRIYFCAGVLVAIGAASSFVLPGPVSPYLYTVAALLVLGVAIWASDEFFERVHRIFWHREWPK
jgi:cytochrome c oxidase assembly factor CtaG